MSARDGRVHHLWLSPANRLSAYAGAFLVTYAALILDPAGQHIDISSFGAVWTPFPLGLVNLYRIVVPIALVAACVGFGVAALVRRRLADIVTAAAIVVPSVLVSEALKLLLPRPYLGDNGYRQNTFPSGHSAVALSAAVGLIVLVPRTRWRRSAIVVSSVAAVFVPWTSVASYAHRPSDVIGASLVVGFVSTCVLWRKRTFLDASRRLLLTLACCIGSGVVLLIAGSAVANVVALSRVPLLGLGWFLLCSAPAALAIGSAPETTPIGESPFPRSGGDG